MTIEQQKGCAKRIGTAAEPQQSGALPPICPPRGRPLCDVVFRYVVVALGTVSGK